MSLIRSVVTIVAIGAVFSAMSNMGVAACSSTGRHFPWGCGTAWFLVLAVLAAIVGLVRATLRASRSSEVDGPGT